ncbi:MAG TPA: hypothetical protein VMB85_20990 [Bryobacteraceae bacterium]|nr:hypothetical protein [Bryobacteraceae bacterium]
MKTRQSRLAVIFDRIYSPQHRETLEQWIVVISIAGFVAHLAAILLARHLAHPPAFVAAAGKNLLSAIYTPFSIVLFYEVLVLISAIPQSTTRGLATQFEIVSLIFIRGFFKDIASLDIESLHQPIQEMAPALVDVGAGLLMFLLVTIFRRASREPARQEPTPALERFIAWKKIVALLLTAYFLWLAVSSLFQVEFEILHPAATIGESRAAFYSDVFTAMIFTDVLILLLSLRVSDRYESVFRNAAFVIAAILIRFSLTAAHPYGAALGMAGMVFGICTLLIYNYNRTLSAART